MQQSLREKASKLADRPYSIRITPDETTDGNPGFVAEVYELQGCLGGGRTRQLAENDVKQAMIDYIESLLDDGMPVPEPIALLPISYSGGFRAGSPGRVMHALPLHVQNGPVKPTQPQLVTAEIAHTA